MLFARTLILSGPVIGVLFVLINTLQAMGAALPSLILSISRQGLLYIPILYTFNVIFHTERMLVMAQPVTDYAAAALAAILFVITYRRMFAKKEAVQGVR